MSMPPHVRRRVQRESTASSVRRALELLPWSLIEEKFPGLPVLYMSA